jgi:hypothetical protein
MIFVSRAIVVAQAYTYSAAIETGDFSDVVLSLTDLVDATTLF